MVSDKARVTVMPSMEIIANDVKCTHGATVADLEEEELFYLMTRGISKLQVSVQRVNSTGRDTSKNRGRKGKGSRAFDL